jgi:hypothetical protein
MLSLSQIYSNSQLLVLIIVRMQDWQFYPIAFPVSYTRAEVVLFSYYFWLGSSTHFVPLT